MGERTGQRAKSLVALDADPKEFAASFGESIRRTRQERGMTQVQLAECAGLSPNYIARLERGELGPSLFVARQICDALEIDMFTLLSQSPITRQTTQRRTAG